MSSLRVLMYHKVDNKERDFLTISRNDFEKQMRYIKANYHPIALSEMIKCRTEKLELPARAVLVSFDDGYLDNFELAYPILKELQIPFCVFLVSNYIGKDIGHDGKIQSFMGKEHLQSMRPLAEYAYHGANHENLMEVPYENWDDLIGSCIQNFKNEGIKMEAAWAYTYGAYPKKEQSKMKFLREIFKKNGICCAFRIGNRINSWPLKRPFKIERLDIRGDQTFFRFKLKILFGKITL